MGAAGDRKMVDMVRGGVGRKEGGKKSMDINFRSSVNGLSGSQLAECLRLPEGDQDAMGTSGEKGENGFIKTLRNQCN